VLAEERDRGTAPVRGELCVQGRAVDVTRDPGEKGVPRGAGHAPVRREDDAEDGYERLRVQGSAGSSVRRTAYRTICVSCPHPGRKRRGRRGPRPPAAATGGRARHPRRVRRTMAPRRADAQL
jgi:hypothetical protein